MISVASFAAMSRGDVSTSHPRAWLSQAGTRVATRGRAMRPNLLRIAACVFMMVAPCWASDVLTEITGQTMGTRYSVKISGPGGAPQLNTAIQNRLDQINQRMSTYEPDSEVSQFNRVDAETWFPVSDETARVVQLSLDISATTMGAFDVTVGPLIRLWKFGEHASNGLNNRRDVIPDNDSIRATLQRVGFRKLQVRSDPPALRKSTTGLEIDLSAVAKGYAVDEIGQILVDAGYTHWMVEIGGEVRVNGTKPDGSDWRIGIEAPTFQQRSLQLVVAPKTGAVATSGDYRNYFEHDGVRYSHTIDPRTGRPCNHSLAGVTIAASRCATADALATAILVMGSENGLEWAEQNQVAALLLSRSGDRIQQQRSSFFTIDVPSDSISQPPWMGVAFMTLIVFGVAMVGMAIGVIVSNRRIKGSCGGLAGMKDEQGRSICDACTNPSPDCRGE